MMKKLGLLILVSLCLYGCQTIVDPIGTITKQVSGITEKIKM